MNRRFLPWIILAMVGLASGLLLSNCAPEPRFKSPALGEVVFMRPIAIDRNPEAALKPGALKLSVMWGGRALVSDKGDPTLNFYGKGDVLRYSYKWSQLESAYHDTGCSREQVRFLDGYLVGSALICDGSLDLSGIVRIEGVEAKGEKRSATSWSSYQLDDDVFGVSIGLY